MPPIPISASSLCFAGILIALAFCLFLSRRPHRPRPPLPPGPSTLPLIGNLLVFPRKHLHLKFSEWGKIYGDSFKLTVMNKTIIVINTPTLVHKLLDVKGSSSANRPRSIIADMIVPDNMDMATGRYANKTWKSLRRTAAHALSSEMVRSRAEYHSAEATQLINDFLHSPEFWFNHIRRSTISSALTIIYGKRGPSLESQDVAEFLQVHPQYLDILDIGTAPPVDLFPFLTLVPKRWAKWKRTVEHIKHLHTLLYDRLLCNVENRISTGEEEKGALLEYAIHNKEKLGLHSRRHLLHLGGVLLQGSESCSAALQNIIYALTLYPHFQERVQREIDNVVGTDRTPTLEDIPKLKYMLAFIEECNRFRPVGPLSIPHEMTRDEEVDGYLYPKGATIFMNIWAICHDERYFDKPNEFNPDRFLENPYGIKNGISDDPERRPNILFGAGKRVCPGIPLARVTLELNTAHLAWTFKFSPVIDQTGQKISPSLNNYRDGVTASPKPTPIAITARSEIHREIIIKHMNNVQSILKVYEE
ncbi:hypothetical protein D9757_009257 [Collybiopsis confluens]|uniref:Cytochrome P450 n=1 Tax=Collybiopsis confluens TaxID=2823264 RepID=A0A8H5HA75_9AGAR|nr:hypothetical protein D9757_009257 [Collybiopsis confluens]